MQVTVTWDVTLHSGVGVLMITGNMLPTGFSITLAYFISHSIPANGHVITTGRHIHGASLSSNFLDATVTSTWDCFVLKAINSDTSTIHYSKGLKFPRTCNAILSHIESNHALKTEDYKMRSKHTYEYRQMHVVIRTISTPFLPIFFNTKEMYSSWFNILFFFPPKSVIPLWFEAFVCQHPIFICFFTEMTFSFLSLLYLVYLISNMPFHVSLLLDHIFLLNISGMLQFRSHTR